MIDLFGEGKPLATEQFVQIANLKNDSAGQSLIQYINGEIIRSTTGMVAANPNDIGAMAQLQARVAALGSLRQLITADPAKYDKEETNA